MSAGDLLASLGAPVHGWPEHALAGALIEWHRDGDEYAQWFASTPAGQLADRHGTNDPRKVGMVDGTEDDFGDLLSDAWATAGRDPEDFGPAWERYQEAALDASTMAGLLAIARDA